MLAVLLLTSTAMAELKIGFIDFPKVMRGSPQAENARKELEKEFVPRKNRLIASAKEIRKMEEKLNRDAAVMGDSERKKLQNSIIKKKREVKRSEEELREDANIRQNEIIGNLQKQILEAARELAKEGGYDLLLTDGVLYASDGVNVTPLLQEKLRKSF